MTPLFAFSPGPNYQWTMTVGGITLDWDEWARLLNVLILSFTLLSVLFTRRFGRWWLTAPIALVAAYVCLTVSSDPQSNFWESWYGFVLVLPLIIVHAVLSFTIPKRKQPFDDWPDSWEPASRFNS